MTPVYQARIPTSISCLDAYRTMASNPARTPPVILTATPDTLAGKLSRESPWHGRSYRHPGSASGSIMPTTLLTVGASGNGTMAGDGSASMSVHQKRAWIARPCRSGPGYVLGAPIRSSRPSLTRSSPEGVRTVPAAVSHPLLWRSDHRLAPVAAELITEQQKSLEFMWRHLC